MSQDVNDIKGAADITTSPCSNGHIHIFLYDQNGDVYAQIIAGDVACARDIAAAIERACVDSEQGKFDDSLH